MLFVVNFRFAPGYASMVPVAADNAVDAVMIARFLMPPGMVREVVEVIEPERVGEVGATVLESWVKEYWNGCVLHRREFEAADFNACCKVASDSFCAIWAACND